MSFVPAEQKWDFPGEGETKTKALRWGNVRGENGVVEWESKQGNMLDPELGEPFVHTKGLGLYQMSPGKSGRILMF